MNIRDNLSLILRALIILTLLIFYVPDLVVSANPSTSEVFINEIDYAQPSADTTAFIEIMNNSANSFYLEYTAFG